MATERQLRNRMRQLQEALAQQEQQARRIQAEITNRTNVQIQQMQNQAQAVFQQRLNETSELYAQRVRQFQESVMQQYRTQVEQLQQQARESRQQTQRLLQEIETCNRELQEELQRMKAQTEQESRVRRETALLAQKEALEAKNLTAQTPHSFFFPQEFDIISDHIQDITSLIDRGMYQAAVSDANCLELEFNLLRTKVAQAFSEWLQAFEDYRTLISLLQGRIRLFEESPLETCAGTFFMKPAELDFWSCGSYSDIAEKISVAYSTFCQMDQKQIMDYLQDQAGTNRHRIYDLITQSKKWEDQLTAVMSCIVSERIFSDQRFVVAQDIAEQLININYLIEANQFAPPIADLCQQEWYIAPDTENPLNSYNLSMLMGNDNHIQFRAIPMREHGLTIANLFFLSVDLPSAADPTTERLVAQEVLTHIKETFERIHISAEVQYIPTSENPPKVIRTKEQLLSPHPSTAAQMRYLERKYH